MLVHWISKKDNKTTDITQFCISVEVNGEYRSCCRTASLDILKTVWDIYYEKFDMQVGDYIGIIDDGGALFYYGVIWSKDINTNGSDIRFSVKDFGIYLNKNDYTYKFKGWKPEDIAYKIANDYGMEIGDIALTGKVINRVFNKTSLYSILTTSYNLTDTGEYLIRFWGKKLNIYRKGAYLCNAKLEKWTNLLTSSASESLDEMINTVYVRDEKDEKLIDTLQNKSDFDWYGSLSTTITKKENEDYKREATNLFKPISRKIEVTNLGNYEFQTGTAVNIYEPWTNLVGNFYIDADSHKWSNGLYTNKLVLNLNNISDGTESGRDIEEDTKKGKKSKMGKDESEVWDIVNPKYK